MGTQKNHLNDYDSFKHPKQMYVVDTQKNHLNDYDSFKHPKQMLRQMDQKKSQFDEKMLIRTQIQSLQYAKK